MSKYLIAVLILLVGKIHGQNYHCLDYFFNSTPTHGIKIYTNIPYANGCQMPTVHFEGYAYGRANTIDVKLSWYIYDGQFIQTNASSAGAWAPKIFLSNENGKVVIFLDDRGYYHRFTVSAYAYGMGESGSWFQGWYTADQPVSGTNIIQVPYKNHLPGSVIIGNVPEQASALVHLIGNHSTTQFRMTLPDYANGAGTGNINLQSWVSEPGVTWDAGGIGMNVNNDNGSPAQFGRLNTQIGQSYIRFIPNGGAMEFNTTNNAGTSYKGSMYLQSGRLGIGQVSPETNLDVAGNARVTNGLATWDNLSFWSNGVSSFIQSNGDEEGLRIKSNTANKIILESNVGIGTNTPGPYQLAVEGIIGARKIKVTQSSWADDVFTPTYQLRSLQEVGKYIEKNGHLPDVPKAKDVIGKYMDISETQTLLLRKIEELTLYIIQLKEENIDLKKRVEKIELTNSRN